LVTASLALAGPVQAQQTVYAWEGTERIELQVLQLAVTPPNRSPSQARAYLASAGFGDFQYAGLDYCNDAHLFVHPDATAAPILAAVDALGSDPENPFFWTFRTDLMGIIGIALGPPQYWIRVEEWVDPDSLLEALGIETTFHEFDSSSGWGVVFPATRSAHEMLDQVDRLHQSPGVLESTIGLPAGCPSGGPGPAPPVVVPTAGRPMLGVLALAICWAAARRLRVIRRASA
jgi:hypothetical protein